MKLTFTLLFIGFTLNLSAQITVYTVCNSGGEVYTIDKDIAVFSDKVNDRINTIRLSPGYQLEIYENKNYSGASKLITSNWNSCNDLDWQNRISSVRIRNLNLPVVYVHTSCKGGEEKAFVQYDIAKLAPEYNDRINFIEVPKNVMVIVYEHANYEGDYKVIESTWNSCNELSWQNRISSLKTFFKK